MMRWRQSAANPAMNRMAAENPSTTEEEPDDPTKGLSAEEFELLDLCLAKAYGVTIAEAGVST